MEDEKRVKGLAKLREPFLPDQVSKLPKPTCSGDEWKKLPKGVCRECGAYHATTKTIHLDYVGHAALTARLLEADPDWNWEPLAFGPDGYPAIDKDGGMWIKLTVCGVTRLGYGDAQGKTGGNATKERIGDALRNAAMRFGAALDLWHKGESPLFGEEESEQVRTEHGNDDSKSIKPKTEPPKAKPTTSMAKKTLADYTAEINAIDILGGLSAWWKDNAADLNKTLSKTDNAKFAAAFSKRKADIGQPADDPKKVACPDRDGDMILVSYCDSDCKNREGCPAHD